MFRYRAIAVGLLALLGLSSCEKLGDYNASNFDQFDPNSPLQVMTAPKVAHIGALAALNDNRALLVGGIVPSPASGATDPVNDVEIYNPATDSWITVAPMLRFRQFPATATLADGRVLVAGDNVLSTTPIRNGFELYDPATDRWTYLGNPLGGAWEEPAALALRGPGTRVLVTGSPGLVLYDVASGAATVLAAFNGARGAALSLLKDGRVLCTYGNRYWIFNPVTNAQPPAGFLRITRYYAGAATGDDGRVYIAGGITTPNFGFNSIPVRGMEVFDPDSARLVRTPAGLLREGGYPCVGMYQRDQRLLYLANGGGNALVDLNSKKSVDLLPYPAGALARRSGQLTDGRLIVLPNTLVDLTKYPRP